MRHPPRGRGGEAWVATQGTCSPRLAQAWVADVRDEASKWVAGVRTRRASAQLQMPASALTLSARFLHGGLDGSRLLRTDGRGRRNQ
jgi:hypothetical protein